MQLSCFLVKVLGFFFCLLKEFLSSKHFCGSISGWIFKIQQIQKKYLLTSWWFGSPITTLTNNVPKNQAPSYLKAQKYENFTYPKVCTFINSCLYDKSIHAYFNQSSERQLGFSRVGIQEKQFSQNIKKNATSIHKFVQICVTVITWNILSIFQEGDGSTEKKFLGAMTQAMCAHTDKFVIAHHK